MKKITKALKAAYRKQFKKFCEKLNESYYYRYIEEFLDEHDLTLDEKQQTKLDKLMKKDLRQELDNNMDFWEEEFVRDIEKLESEAEKYDSELDYNDILNWGYASDFTSKAYKLQEHWEDVVSFYEFDTYDYLESLVA